MVSLVTEQYVRARPACYVQLTFQGYLRWMQTQGMMLGILWTVLLLFIIIIINQKFYVCGYELVGKTLEFTRKERHVRIFGTESLLIEIVRFSRSWV